MKTMGTLSLFALGAIVLVSLIASIAYDGNWGIAALVLFVPLMFGILVLQWDNNRMLRAITQALMDENGDVRPGFAGTLQALWQSMRETKQ